MINSVKIMMHPERVTARAPRAVGYGNTGVATGVATAGIIMSPRAIGILEMHALEENLIYIIE
jgi:hypothetical protein